MRVSLAVLASALAANAPAPAPTPVATPVPAPAPPVKPARLPGFAAELAQRPPIDGPSGWRVIPDDQAWAALASASPTQRQSARWDYAVSLIGSNRAAEALGVLQVMLADDPDLGLVAAFQLALGSVNAMLNRPSEALATLSMPALAANAEACAWRLRALARAMLGSDALGQVNCALPAINARQGAARSPFILTAAQVAIDANHPDRAMNWLAAFSDRDPGANLLRGRILMAQGDVPGARLRFARAEQSGDLPQKLEARIDQIELAASQHGIAPADGIKQLGAIRFAWRGGEIERHALQVEYRLASDSGDLRGALRAGATLFRFFEPGADSGPMLTQLRTALASALAPDSKVPLVDAAGIYWDYRELAPAGAEGDLLVGRLASRLEDAGLYGRGAELLQYQLLQRTQDVARGPLSVKVAALHILSGHPERAIDVLRSTEGPSYSDPMRFDRKRVEAVALFQIGKPEAAMAALDDVPGGDRLRAEMLWKRDDWGAFVAANEAHLPAPGTLDPVAQAIVLRHAVALAMLGREDQLAGLRSRYETAFARLPSGGVFELLTREPRGVDPAALSGAMAAIPAASPAGTLGDLLEVDTKAAQNGG